jgi:hypothetical protein
MTMLKASVSGSFHRFMPEIEAAVHELTGRGVRVVSPADPTIVDAIGEFLFVASDRVRSVRLVQDRHLESIGGSDFLWLVCPDGYVGQSASMELGFAAANNVPVFAITAPADLTLRHYVTTVPSIDQLLATMPQSGARRDTFLIDPHASVESAHLILERIDAAFRGAPRSITNDVASDTYGNCAELVALFPPSPAINR